MDKPEHVSVPKDDLLKMLRRILRLDGKAPYDSFVEQCEAVEMLKLVTQGESNAG